MTIALATPQSAKDTRRITEQDPDYQRLHGRWHRKFLASVKQYARELQHSTPEHEHAVQGAFVRRHTRLLAQCYSEGHAAGQRDYWEAVSLKRHTPHAPDHQQLARRLRFYTPSVVKMAIEGMQAWHETQRKRAHGLSEVTLADTSSLDAWLAGLDNRVTLQAEASWMGLQDGYTNESGVDPASPYAVLYWDLEPMAKHCFPAGTMITTPDGVKPIETIRVGDLVETLSGPRRVTRLFRNVHNGALIRVEASGRAVDCTPNHPFLTQRGWVEAGELRNGEQVVLAQDGGNFVASHIRLPNAHDGITAGFQIGILRAISALLRELTWCQWHETRMAVPVIPIGLNDQRANADVHDELILDESRRLKRNAQLSEHSPQPSLQFAGLVTLDPLMSSDKLGVNHSRLIRMGVIPRSHLRLHVDTLHRVVASHVRTRSLVDDTLASVTTERKANLHRFIAHLRLRQTECCRNGGGSISRVVLTQIRETFGCPDGWSGARRDIATASTQVLSAQSVMAATGARFELANIVTLPAHIDDEMAIPTGNATETVDTRSRLYKRLPALLTLVLRRHSDTPPVRIPSVSQETNVYNIEVEDVHHYIANGFVVHNCGDCLQLANDSPYDPPGSGGNELQQTPGDGQTECGASCKCSLRYGYFDGHRDIGGMKITPPAAGEPLNDGQKSALDLMRATSDAWAEHAPNLPELPSFFGDTPVDMPAMDWNELTPKQRQLVGQWLEALQTWQTATAPEGNAALVTDSNVLRAEAARMRDIVQPDHEETAGDVWQMQHALAERLRGSPGWDKVVADLSYPEMTFSGHVFTPEMNAISTLNSRWTTDVINYDPMNVALRMAANDEFKLGLDVHAYNDQVMQAASDAYSQYGAGLRSYVRAVYDTSQDWFKENDITELVVYRGQHFAVAPQEIAFDGQPRVQEFSSEAFSSFSTDPQLSYDWATSISSHEYGMIAMARIPVSEIMGTPFTSMAKQGESEFLVLGSNDRPMQVIAWSADSAPANLSGALDLLAAAKGKS